MENNIELLNNVHSKWSNMEDKVKQVQSWLSETAPTCICKIEANQLPIDQRGEMIKHLQNECQEIAFLFQNVNEKFSSVRGKVLCIHRMAKKFLDCMPYDSVSVVCFTCNSMMNTQCSALYIASVTQQAFVMKSCESGFQQPVSRRLYIKLHSHGNS